MSGNMNESVNAEGRLSDDMLDNVSGGAGLDSGILRNTVYDMSEKIDILSAVKYETMDGRIHLLNGSVRSGRQGASRQDTLPETEIHKA